VTHQKVRHARRALSQERRIVRCERVESVPVRCITVAAESHMFLAGRSMVPTHNSPLTGATAICEFRGPVVFDGWARAGDVYDCSRHGCSCRWKWHYEPGEPKGRTWGSPGLPSPWVQVAAVSEAQTANTWAALHAFLAANGGRCTPSRPSSSTRSGPGCERHVVADIKYSPKPGTCRCACGWEGTQRLGAPPSADGARAAHPGTVAI